MSATRIARAIARLAFGLASLALAAHALAQAPAAGDETLSAIVGLKTRALPEARTAETLGAERKGSGVLVREGYVLTIGYLVIEADSIVVTGAKGESVPASVVAYDHASGFGLLKLAAPLAGRPMKLGRPAALEARVPAMVASGGAEGARIVYVVSRRSFAGGWEYLLDSAIFTYPPVPEWSGAALVSKEGELLGIGSLIVPDAVEPGTQSPGNMFVPVDLIAPILDELIAAGRSPRATRPWLGLYSDELRGRVFVSRVTRGGPAERAGIRPGDLVLGVGAGAVASQADFYRKVWALGAPGVDVPLRVLQGDQVKPITVRSADRADFLERKPTY